MKDRTSRPGLWAAPTLALSVLTLGIALSGCSHSVAPAAAARPVIALPVQAIDASPAAQFPGEVHSRYEMPLSFRVPGQLVARSAHLGDQVKKGQVLAQLDAADAARTRASAQAALDAAEHRLTFATQQRDRDEAQSAQNLISQLQLDQTRDAYASALAGRDEARQQLALADAQWHYQTLVADHDGAITSEQAEVGQVLAAGQPVFGLAWSGERDVIFSVPEDQLKLFAYSFSTYVQPLNLKEANPAVAQGGTEFSIIEDEILNSVVPKLGNYPKAVVVLTDGYGYFSSTRPKTQMENNWLWLVCVDNPYPNRCGKDMNIDKFCEGMKFNS